ncbi:MAG: polysaccharide deacetylase family protein [Nanoarchaeota archaeon]|nr:polysaccharide deacetylase family protein [Nanoarchaeota archaeon]
MIYLTGDVHHDLEGYWEQDIAGNEIKAAKKYLSILKKYKISCTLFLNGVILDKEAEKVRELSEFDVEIGGHTYNNFGKMNVFKSYINRKRYNCIYGPASFQKKDIEKTKKAFEKLGIKMNSWRTHAFGSNETTFDILRGFGIKYESDLLGNQKPFEEKGLVHMPINIPVDINTISIGPLKPENRDSFASCTKGRIEPLEWFGIVKKRVEYNEKNNIDSIILIHPITMAALDDFALFDNIAKFLSKYESKKISEYSIIKH